jgi:hypothetical protein
MSGIQLAVLASSLVSVALLLWFRFMNDVALAGRRAILFATIALGIGLGAVALAREPGWIGGTLAILCIALGLLWLLLGALGRQSRQVPHLAVGQLLPAISAPDHSGAIFDLESLRGHPILIKLFRGHW